MKRLTATRVQKPMGTLSQMFAGLTHYVAPERLHKISRSIPKVMIVTGDEDYLVHPRNSEYLKANMPEAEYIVFPKTGHAIHLQWPKRYSELLERVIQEGSTRAKAEINN